MERTELREQFFAEVRNDPYAHVISRLWMQAWVEGYEQALRDNGLEEQRRRKSSGERMDDAAEYLTDRKRKAEAEFIIAQAQIGSLLSRASFQERSPDDG